MPGLESESKSQSQFSVIKPLETLSYFFVQAIRAAGTAAYEYLSIKFTIFGKAIKDIRDFNRDKEQFILSVLYKRAAAEDNISWITIMPPLISRCTLGLIPIPTRICVVTGDRENIMQVGDYGESNGDPVARSVFDFTIPVVGKKTQINEQGAKAFREKSLLRKHLMNSDALYIASTVARRRFRDTIADWKETNSYQKQMTYIGANILGECILGVPELPMSYIPGLREVSKVFLDPAHDKERIKKAATFTKNLNKEILSKYRDEVIAADKFIAADLRENKLLDDTFDILDDEEKLKRLLNRMGASVFVVEGNISSTIMAGVAYLNQTPVIKERLRQEVDDFKAEKNLGEGELSVEDLRQLPYLNCIYLETLRLVSSAPAVVRKTSRDALITVEDKKKNKKTYQIPAHSVLFVPLRSMHHDPCIWKNPQQFNPSRFETEEKETTDFRKKIVSFSVGKRACPAQNGFAEVVFKSVLTESLSYNFDFSEPIEEVPPYTLEPYWRREYYAKVSREDKTMALTSPKFRC